MQDAKIMVSYMKQRLTIEAISYQA